MYVELSGVFIVIVVALFEVDLVGSEGLEGMKVEECFVFLLVRSTRPGRAEWPSFILPGALLMSGSLAKRLRKTGTGAA